MFYCRIEDEEGPCAYPKDCTGVPNGRYPICELDCVWYFTCVEGNNAGNTQCIGKSGRCRGRGGGGGQLYPGKSY